MHSKHHQQMAEPCPAPSSLRALAKLKRWLHGTALLGLVCSSSLALADGDEHRSGALRLTGSIPIPTTLAPLHGWDISWIDADTQQFFLADRSNKSVDVRQCVGQVVCGSTRLDLLSLRREQDRSMNAAERMAT